MTLPKGCMVDPPAGWQFGFPKQFLPKDGESLEEWLIREGYPESMIHLAQMSTRFWEAQ